MKEVLQTKLGPNPFVIPCFQLAVIICFETKLVYLFSKW